jgi:hypothetical protein
VVLKKNCLLLLTVPPHSHHCRSRPTKEYFRQMDKQLKRFNTQLHE